MWSDNETTLDLLNINHYVSTVIEVVSDKTLLPVTVGVFGDWGNGKSSLLKMVKAKLDTEEGTLCLFFNGWLFEDYDDAKAALMGTILDEIEKKPRLTKKAKDIIYTLKTKVDWLGLMGVAGKYGLGLTLGGPAGGVGVLASDIFSKIKEKAPDLDLEDIKKFIKEEGADSSKVRKTVVEFRKEFEELLKESKIKKLVIIIDDLDRCLPDTIINTLEAVKLFLSCNDTAFIISVDERIIKYAINDRYNKFDSKQRDDISRDYIEKLIQIPLRIPLMNKSEMKTYINLLFVSKHLNQTQFNKLLKKVDDERKGDQFNVSCDVNWLKQNTPTENFSEELNEELMITQQINDLLYDFLKGNPRQVKRFINALLLRIKIAGLRGVSLKKPLLAKLMALEYKYPEEFRTLANWQGSHAGLPKQIEDLEKLAKEDPKEENDNYKKWLQSDWLVRWLKSDPCLKEQNLEPYFYISRDSLSYFSSSNVELSDTEKEVFKKLTSTSQSHRTSGASDFKELDTDGAARVVKILAEKITKADLSNDEGELVKTIASLPNHKIEVAGNILDVISSIDPDYIDPGIPPEISRFRSSLSPELQQKVDDLFEKFKQSNNERLKLSLES
ncbi:MAG: P-loop NTPase fold protein [Patescibacteria group bacterium]